MATSSSADGPRARVTGPRQAFPAATGHHRLLDDRWCLAYLRFRNHHGLLEQNRLLEHDRFLERRFLDQHGFLDDHRFFGPRRFLQDSRFLEHHWFLEHGRLLERH